MDFNAKHTRAILQFFVLIFLSVAGILGAYNFKAIRQFFIGAAGQEANIVIQTDNVQGTLSRPWRNLAQGGEDKNWRLGPLTNQVKVLNTEYIRIDHLTDFYDIVHGTSGNLSYDFSKLDPIIADIRAAGATPFLSLSYMPLAFATNGDITAPPANWGDWQNTTRAIIEHVSGTLNIPNVYYEVWNEPDLFGGYKTYGSRNYLTMYTYAAQGAKQARVKQPYKFGGPAVTALYQNWVDALVKLSIDQNLPLDFFSWHRYSTSIDTFRSDVSTVHNWLAPYPSKQNIELLITEWGHDPKNNAGYDNNFGAIHTMAVSTEFVDLINRAFLFEIQDGKDPAGNVHWGRWGIFDSTGAPKPRYNALRFLEKLGSQKLQLLGRGTWVKGIAAKDGEDTTALIINYDSQSRHIETTPVTFTGITPGNFIITEQYFGKSPIERPVATTSGELRIAIPFEVNSAVFLRLHHL
ncbi:MAG TPA: glycosyl hydrolase [Patescibacteria group bacterium]|nr:glycosyl hydrolase [Patescibacteria group bacterium]